MEWEGAHKAFLLTEKLLIADGHWGRQLIFFKSVSYGTLSVLYLMVPHPCIYGHYQVDTVGKEEKKRKRKEKEKGEEINLGIECRDWSMSY